MKKNLAILLAAVLMCGLLAGCEASPAAVIPADSPYIGTWEATRATASGEETDAKEALGEMFIFTLKADGTATVTAEDEVSEGTWSISSDGVNLRMKDAKKDLKFKSEDGTLVMSVLGCKIYFEKK